MRTKLRIGQWIAVLLFLLCGTAIAQKHVFLPTNLSRVRALGLAGAVISLEDGLGAISYNPANYSLYRENMRFRVTLFLSPLAPFLIRNNREPFFGRPVQQKEANLATVLSFFKAINFTISSLEIGLLAGEPKLLADEAYEDASFLHVNSLYNNHFESLVLRLRLADQVTVGSGLHLLYWDDGKHGRRWALAANYGVTMQPHRRVRFGVTLHTFPNNVASYRMNLEEIADEAISLGVSYETPWHLRAAFDVRNVGVGQSGPREQYFAGIEQELFGQVALRGGLQFHPGENRFVYAAGIGLLNTNLFHSERTRFRINQFAINYAIIIKHMNFEDVYYHAFSILLRI